MMKALRKNRGLKALAIVLAVACSFTAGFCALTGVGFWWEGHKSSYEDTGIYDAIVSNYALAAWNQYLRENYPGNTQEEQLSSAEWVAKDQKLLADSRFYYQIINNTTGKVVATNLESGVSTDVLTESSADASLQDYYNHAYSYHQHSYSIYGLDSILRLAPSDNYAGNYTDSNEETAEYAEAEGTYSGEYIGGYYRLEEDGALTGLGNFGGSDAVQAALNEGSLYVFIDNGASGLYQAIGISYDPQGYLEDYEEWFAVESCSITSENFLQVGGYEIETIDGSGIDLYYLTEDVTLHQYDPDTSEIDLYELMTMGALYARSDADNLFYRVGGTGIDNNGSTFYQYSIIYFPDMEEAANQSESADTAVQSVDQMISSDANLYHISYGFSSENGTLTELDTGLQAYTQYKQMYPVMLALAVLSCLVVLFSVVWLCIAAGYSNRQTEENAICLNQFDRFWLEPVLLIWLICVSVLCLISLPLCASIDLEDMIHMSMPIFNGRTILCGGVVGCWLAGMMVLCLPVLLTLIRRIRSHSIGKSLLVVWLWKHLKNVLRRMFRMILQNTGLAVKVGAGYAVFALVTTWLSLIGGIGVVLLLLLHIVVFCALMYWCMGFSTIRKGTKRLNQGEMDAQIDTNLMPPDLRELGEELNNLSVGIQRAVEKQMQSERFKAELVTNVSHDLKTPLTSIINYVDLLKKTNITDPTALEYLDVLDRKSQRLKKLTEDLVEASKASTGAMKVELTELDLCQLVGQALGEYDEKLAKAHVKPVLNLPDPPVTVMADGRHLWRVLDNLLNNCTKYAMEGTRVYVELRKQEKNAVLEIKNISAEPLNLTAEELMERFVRGDSSRSTEGSGLGLSIAMSLMKLMGGTFRIQVDGDLFKAVVTMPMVQNSPDMEKGVTSHEVVK